MSTLFSGAGKDVTIAMASGAVLTFGGAAVAICSTAMGSTNWTSVLGACCGAGLAIQSIATAERCMEKQKEMDRLTLKQKRVVENFVSALFPVQQVTRQKETDVANFCAFLKDSANSMDSALREASFWNEIENYSKPFSKEQQYFAKMDTELHRQLKDLLNSRPNIEGGSLIIEETDMLERIDELLLAHEARCAQGLVTLEQEFKENAQLVVYLENNEPNIDVKKDSPMREIVPGENRDIPYFQSPKHFEKKVPNLGPEAPDSKMDHSTSQIYPDSPSTHRDVYYPEVSPRHTPKKSPKSPRKSPKSPNKSPKKSPKSPNKSPKKSPKSPNKSPKRSPQH